EEISHRTGCWLYLAAHHPNVSGGFIHYASPRLLTEGPEQAEIMHKAAKATFHGLKLARVQETAQLSADLLNTQAQLVESQKKQVEMERELAEYRKDLEAKAQVDTERASLMAQLQHESERN
ncbi:hypothetical protein BT96DRAFT_828236, partial [Gymnopus androsaceus JB14]